LKTVQEQIFLAEVAENVALVHKLSANSAPRTMPSALFPPEIMFLLRFKGEGDSLFVLLDGFFWFSTEFVLCSRKESLDVFAVPVDGEGPE